MNSDTDGVAPCRHPEVPPDWLVDKVVRLIEQELPADEVVLGKHGLSAAEYTSAYRAAVERLRGRLSATDRAKRQFVERVLDAGVQAGHFRTVGLEKEEQTRVYRVQLRTGMLVGLIRKGCPDGNHSTRWARPDWADELFLWWLCPRSSAHEPGTGIWKGVSRLKKKVLAEPKNQLHGVIFFDAACGSPQRPCPKDAFGMDIDGIRYPPPCVFTLPPVSEPQVSPRNWRGEVSAHFASSLLSLFGVPDSEVERHTSFVGFGVPRGPATRTRITNRYGDGRVCSHTS